MVLTIGIITDVISSCRDGVRKDKMVQNEEFDMGMPSSLQDGWIVCDLPVVETTGFITLSLRDKEGIVFFRQAPAKSVKLKT